MILRTLLLLAFTCGTFLTADADESRTLFDFEDGSKWSTVNDGVMGGRSDGRVAATGDGTLRFYGNLSLANNGGFSSARSERKDLELAAGDLLVLRVRGDGRTYNMNLFTPTLRMAFSYRASFDTVEGEWVDVTIPVDEFVGTSFGRVVRNAQLNPASVNRVGVILSDKQAGPFLLEIDSIKVVSGSAATEMQQQAKAAQTAANWKAFLER